MTKLSQDNKWTYTNFRGSPNETDSPNSGRNCKIAFADFFKAFGKITKPYYEFFSYPINIGVADFFNFNSEFQI